MRDGEAARAFARADQRVLLVRRADEYAVVEPLRLDEFELPFDVRPGENEHDPAVGAIVFQDAFRQHRAVVRAASDHPVQAYVDGAVGIQRIPRIRTARMGAYRAFEATRVIAVGEVIVAVRIRTLVGVIAFGRSGERSPALPATHHLRPEEGFVCAVSCSCTEISAVCRHFRVELAEHDICAVAAEDVGNRHRRKLSGFIWIPEDDLSGLQRPFVRIRRRLPRALHRRLPDAVFEAE